MATDLYVPRGNHPEPPTTLVPKIVYSDEGAPTLQAPEGALYLDETTGIIYEMRDGTWTIVASPSGGGSTQVFKSTADPSANPGVPAAVHYRTDTGGVWFWNGSSWDQVIG